MSALYTCQYKEIIYINTDLNEIQKILQTKLGLSCANLFYLILFLRLSMVLPITMHH